MANALSTIKNLVIDMDGVLWHGETPLPGLNRFFETLNAHGIPFVLATNNASKTPQQYIEKLGRFGVTVTAVQILTSAEATAEFLREEYAAGTAVYACGDVGLHQALARCGFRLVSKEAVVEGALADLVVVGFSRKTHYTDLAAAAILIGKGARFIGTNPDTSFPSELGPLPGAGALLALLTAATGVAPITIGKPSPAMFLEALKRLNAQPENTAMLGDRLNTDIAGATAVGLHTILVLTGITQPADLPNSAVQPDFVFDSIAALADAFNAARE